MKFSNRKSFAKGAAASAFLLLASLLPVVGSQTVASASPTNASSTSAPTAGVVSVEYTTQNPFSPTSASAAAAPAVVNPAGCKLFASVVHERSGTPPNVGNKPYTRCNYAVTSIHQSVQMWKNGALGPDAVDSPFPGGNTIQANYTQYNVEAFCTNTLPTYWFATVDGTIVEGGTTYYAYVQTPTTSALNCGT